jgi:CrcB protein
VLSLAATGLLGGFTTASTLAADVLRLWEDGARRAAVLDLLLSVVPGVLLAAAGLALGRAL